MTASKYTRILFGTALAILGIGCTRSDMAQAEQQVTLYARRTAVNTQRSIERAVGAGSIRQNQAPRSRAAQPLAGVDTPARYPQYNANLRSLEAYMIRRVNEKRRSLKLPQLRTDATLADTARAHSLEMREKKYFAHESPTAALQHPIDRYRAVFRTTPAMVAENIYRAWSSAPHKVTTADIDKAHQALLNSPGHRANLLDSRVTNIGIGIIQNTNGDIWLTQMFSRPTW